MTSAQVVAGTFVNRGGLSDIALPFPSRESSPPPLGGRSLFHVLEKVAFGGGTGRLTLAAPPVSVELWMTPDGIHTFTAEGHDVEAEAVRILVGRTIIDETSARMALSESQASGKRAMYVLFEQRLVTAAQVVRAVREARTDVLRTLCKAPSGAFRFDPEAVPTGVSDPVVSDLRAKVVHLLRDALSTTYVRELLPLLSTLDGRYPRYRGQGAQPVPGLRFDDKERHFVENVLDGTRLPRQVFEASQLSPHGCARLLYLLLGFGLVEVLRQSTAETGVLTPEQMLQRLLEEKTAADHFGALDLHWTCHPDDISQAHVKLLRQYGAESPARKREGCGPVLDRLLARAEAAFEALKDKAPRRAYREQLYGPQRLETAAAFLAQQAEENRGINRKKALRLIECAMDLSDNAAFVAARAEIAKT